MQVLLPRTEKIPVASVTSPGTIETIEEKTQADS